MNTENALVCDTNGTTHDLDQFNYLGSLGNIHAYISAVQKIPLLSHEEESEFAKQLREQNNLQAAQRLILSHLRFVVSIARNYLGYGLPHADLIQEGNIGLMRAVKRFDERQNVRLVSYAVYWIKAQIHEYILKNWRLVKTITTKAQRKLFFNLRSYKENDHQFSNKQVETIAKDLDVKQRDVLDMEMCMNTKEISLDLPQSDSNSSNDFSPLEYLHSSADEPLEQINFKKREHLHTEGIQQALNQLDARSRRIVESRWLADDEKNSVTLQDLAQEFGVSAERIRQIEVAAFKKMKLALMPYTS